MPRLKITYKMAIILATMSFGPMLASSLTSLFIEDPGEIQRNRAEISQRVATACSTFLSTRDPRGLQRSCRNALINNEDLLSLKILRHDGLVLYSSPDHDRNWTLSPESPSTINQLRVPLMKGESVHAELEIAYRPVASSLFKTVLNWLVVIVIGFVLNFGSFSLFLNRALSVLDPKSAVPKRVRNTLDTIVGGVVILDAQGKVLLVNDSFVKCMNLTIDEMTDQELSKLEWKKEEEGEWPWEYAIREKSQRAGVKLDLLVDSRRLTFMVNATPVFDGQERITGALISFEDITLMEEQRRHLLEVLTDLETSKEQIRRQNEILHELATRDGLTGALNRRALFEKIEAMWPDRNDGDRGLVTIMMDVDHFKKLNDQYGHSAGDSVLKDVVKTVSRIVEGRAILGRYGGEEFCVVLQHATLHEGESLAEEIRGGIQQQLADPYKVTASLGVSSSIYGAATIQNQIEQADLGLYAAKHGGRNGYRVWTPKLEEEAREAEVKKAAKLASTDIEELPISYHAVVALNSAMGTRFPRLASHSHRVAELSVSLARGLVPVGKLYILEMAAMLHDVGCLSLQRSDEQWVDSHRCGEGENQELIQQTSTLLHSAFNSPELLKIIRYHGMKFANDSEIRGDKLPLGSRIIAIANAYDALTSELALEPKTHEQAIEWLMQRQGVEFDPVLLERFQGSPLGWSPQYHGGDTELSDSHAVMIGYQIERLIHGFESGNLPLLKSRLDSLEVLAKTNAMPMICMIIQELRTDVERKAVADWGSLLPIVQDLVEMCLTIQRAHLRSALSDPSSKQLAWRDVLQSYDLPS
jgi:diguanylate cyclase (GGDEF)-like protein/PAS domain S-box-containing protein